MTGPAADRFAADLAALASPDTRLGIAVSGGPDSLALLLLAAGARPGEVEAATVDHRLRPGSERDAETVAKICAGLGVPHRTLSARWPAPPTANVQALARIERYALLTAWAREQGLAAVATGHQADDQAETLLMRLARGSGVAGLGGTRPSRLLAPGIRLVRPLLRWRRAELAVLLAEAGIDAVDDPANRDPRHDRSRMRAWLAQADWADPARLAASAAHLREADDALDWASARLAAERMTRTGDGIALDPADLPPELRRRLLLRAFDELTVLRPSGPDLARAMTMLDQGGVATLAGLRLSGGQPWRIAPAPPRTRPG